MANIEILKQLRKNLGYDKFDIAILERVAENYSPHDRPWMINKYYGLVLGIPKRGNSLRLITLSERVNGPESAVFESNCPKVLTTSKITGVFIPADSDFVEFETRNSRYRLIILSE